MKRERRHELQHNELADWLGQTFEKLKPYQNAVVIVLVLIVVVLGVYLWWSQASQSQTTQAWDDLERGLATGNYGGLEKVAEVYQNTSAADMAAVVAADFRLTDACDKSLRDKALADQQLGRAIELYEKCLQRTASPTLRQRATFGLARAYEARGDLQSAARQYRHIVDDWPSGAYAAVARERVADLEKPDIKQLYADLAKANPKAVASPESSLPGEVPRFAPEGLPANPPAGGKDINFEDLGKGKNKGSDTTTKPN
jgi:tetratricopeptide (TPR) repeat protein